MNTDKKIVFIDSYSPQERRLAQLIISKKRLREKFEFFFTDRHFSWSEIWQFEPDYIIQSISLGKGLKRKSAGYRVMSDFEMFGVS